MSISTKELLSAVSKLVEDKQVRVTVTESLKGGGIALATTTAGGLLLGPVGLAVGGVVGGLSAYFMGKDKFKSLPEIIMEDMSDDQRERLAASVRAVIAHLRVEKAALLLPLLLKNQGVKEAVIKNVFAFVEQEMKLEIVD